MRIVTQHRTGGPEVFEIADVDDPTAGPGEVRLATSAIGVNPVDAAVRAGYGTGPLGVPAADLARLIEINCEVDPTNPFRISHPGTLRR
ncbi:MAG: hypothetical protein H0T99_05350 [Geodermatophilaceae bacterium]|nr:hypothetical protein [Geodermatophilaceae bacterium]